MPTPEDLIKAQRDERDKNDREKAIRELSYKNLDAADMRKIEGDKARKAYLDREKKQGRIISPDSLGMADQAGKKKEARLLKIAKAKAEKKMPPKKYSKTLIQPSAGRTKFVAPTPVKVKG